MSDAKKMLKELSYTHLVPKDEQGRELVAVVRCKDCKHTAESTILGYVRCLEHRVTMLATNYCAHGERKADEETD